MKSNLLKSNLILPPYLVPYKKATYQDQFDLNYIREEIKEDRKRMKGITDCERKQLRQGSPPPISEGIHKGLKVTDITAEINKIKKDNVYGQSFHAADDNWFDDW